MSEEIKAPVPEFDFRKNRRFLRPKNIAIIVFILAFAVGLIIEIWKHSDKHIRSLLEDNRSAFEACAEYFGVDGENTIEIGDVKDTDTNTVKKSSYASVETLMDRLEGKPIVGEIKKLADAGVQKITLYGYEVRFYTDTNSGLFYISPKSTGQPDFYYPDGYLDENLIEDTWYRFK